MPYLSMDHKTSQHPLSLDNISLFFWGFCSGFLLWAGYWPLTFFLIFPLYKKAHMYLGFCCSAFLIVLLYFSPLFLINQIIRCDRDTCSWQSPFFRHLPVYYKLSDGPGLYRIKTAQLFFSESVVIPRVWFEVVCADFIKPHPHQSHSQGSSMALDFFATFYLIKPCAGQTLLWRNLFGALGLKHLLCISAWHAYHLLKICNKRLSLFSILGGGAALFLNLPVPFLIAYIKILIERIPIIKNDNTGPVFMSVILAVFLSSPFCWLNIGTWMTVYYILLIDQIGFCHLSLRMSSLGWASLMGWPLEVLPWFIGWLLEPYFIYFWGLAGILFVLSIGSTTRVDFVLDYLYTFLSSCRISKGSNLLIPEMMGPFLLIYPFFTRPTLLNSHNMRPLQSLYPLYR